MSFDRLKEATSDVESEKSCVNSSTSFRSSFVEENVEGEDLSSSDVPEC